MADDKLIRPGLQTIDHGIAIADTQNWTIQFENAGFSNGFRQVLPSGCRDVVRCLLGIRQPERRSAVTTATDNTYTH
jgi:hypothetical protein